MYQAQEERGKWVAYAAAAVLVLYGLSLAATPLPAETIHVQISSAYLTALRGAIAESADPAESIQP